MGKDTEIEDTHRHRWGEIERQRDRRRRTLRQKEGYIDREIFRPECRDIPVDRWEECSNRGVKGKQQRRIQRKTDIGQKTQRLKNMQMGGVYRKKRGRVTTDTEMVIIKRKMYCADAIFNMDMYLVLFVLFSVVNDITSVKKNHPLPFYHPLPPSFLNSLEFIGLASSFHLNQLRSFILYLKNIKMAQQRLPL